MTTDLTLLANGPAVLDVRRGSRAMSRLETHGVLRQAAIDIEVSISEAKIDGQTTATGTAMAAVCKVGQAQTAMEQLAPQTSGRLSLLADHHTFAVAGELDSLQRRLRRI